MEISRRPARAPSSTEGGRAHRGSPGAVVTDELDQARLYKTFMVTRNAKARGELKRSGARWRKPWRHSFFRCPEGAVEDCFSEGTLGWLRYGVGLRSRRSGGALKPYTDLGFDVFERHPNVFFVGSEAQHAHPNHEVATKSGSGEVDPSPLIDASEQEGVSGIERGVVLVGGPVSKSKQGQLWFGDQRHRLCLHAKRTGSDLATGLEQRAWHDS